MHPLNSQEYTASNDLFFHAPRVRNAPIKSSMTTVPGLPKKLKIFRIAGSKYWQLRLYSAGKYITQSLKTTDKDEALVKAEALFNALLTSGRYVDRLNQTQLQTQTLGADRLHDLIQEILHAELEKVSRDEIKHASFVMAKIRLESLVFDFFKDMPLKDVNAQALENFVSFLTQKQFSSATIQGYIAQARKLLRLLHRNHLIPSIPAFPPLKSQINPRGGFTLTEYKRLLQTARHLQSMTFTDWGEGKRPWIRRAYHQMPPEMYWLIRFMVYTFVRPGDIRQIKNKHIELIRNNFSYLRLNLPEVKRHKSATVSLPRAVLTYQHILAYQTARGYGKPNNYVFFPELANRRLVLDVIGWGFNWILKTLDLKQGPHGTDRSFYSLRHTAITFRLIYGGNIDLLTLARNARTSVEMIEKFYASTLSAEMNIQLLHSKRRS